VKVSSKSFGKHGLVFLRSRVVATEEKQGVEAILVSQVGSQVADDGRVVLVQMHSTIDEVFTFALSTEAAERLADLILRQVAARRLG
jgi:hypothetical protein